MLNLDEAIKHCEYKAEELKKKAEFAEKEGNYRKEDCLECAAEHEQLAEWLKELRDYREGKRTCENCKHQDKTELDFPCSVCRCNHPNKFEWRTDK